MGNLGNKTVLVAAVGGTIAGIGDNEKTVGYNSAQIEINSLIYKNKHFFDLANLKTYQFSNIDSREMTPEYWLKLSNFINTYAKTTEIDGFVITHGTDTLEETAFFLNLTLKTKKPVVVTGSMRPSTAISEDGMLNLYQSIALAKSDIAVGKGVLIVFSEGIYGARDIHKVNCFRAEAFNHKDLGGYGYIQDENIYFYNSSIKPNTVDSEFDVKNLEKLPNVEIVYFYAGANIKLLETAHDISEGLVIGGVGNGGSSIEWNEKINSYVESGFPVVRSSRVANGIVTSELKEKSKDNVIYSNSLPPQKARILLALSLTKTKKINEIKEYFEKY
jgi:L-asparaginase